MLAYFANISVKRGTGKFDNRLSLVAVYCDEGKKG
jgi:hypothetical protein